MFEIASFKCDEISKGRPIVPRQTLLPLLSLLLTTKFSSAHKNHIELFSAFLDENREFEKENRQKSTQYNFNCSFSISPLA